jgi:hypothetical protein
MTGTAPATEQWVCQGTRATSGGKKATSWLLPAGKRVIFTGQASYVTGATYEVQCSREDGATYMHGKPRFLHAAGPGDEQVQAWAAATAHAEAQLARKAMETKAKGADALDEALAPLLKIAQAMSTGAERDMLAATVLRRIQRAR